MIRKIKAQKRYVWIGDAEGKYIYYDQKLKIPVEVSDGTYRNLKSKNIKTEQLMPLIFAFSGIGGWYGLSFIDFGKYTIFHVIFFLIFMIISAILTFNYIYNYQYKNSQNAKPTKLSNLEIAFENSKFFKKYIKTEITNVIKITEFFKILPVLIICMIFVIWFSYDIFTNKIIGHPIFESSHEGFKSSVIKLIVYLSSGFIFSTSITLILQNPVINKLNVLEKYQKNEIKQGDINNGK